jgi:hypothetical protein
VAATLNGDGSAARAPALPPEAHQGGMHGTARSCPITLSGYQGRLRLPPQAARTKGPPKNAAAPIINRAKRTARPGRSTPPEAVATYAGRALQRQAHHSLSLDEVEDACGGTFTRWKRERLTDMRERNRGQFVFYCQLNSLRLAFAAVSAQSASGRPLRRLGRSPCGRRSGRAATAATRRPRGQTELCSPRR